MDGFDSFDFSGESGGFIGGGFELETKQLVMQRGAEAESVIRHSEVELGAPEPVPSPNPGRLVAADSWLKGPTTNVFSGWVATTWDIAGEPPADCTAWFERSHRGLKYPSGYDAATRPNRPASPPPPTLPASPGW
jgi:hypothetical protein